MKIVLLGGTGFIGRRLADLCRTTGADVTVVSRHVPPAANLLGGVTYVQGDCASPEVLKQVLRPDHHVVFLAYNSVPKTSFDDPLRDIQENLPLAIALLGVLREVRVRRLLYVSSGGTVYGPTDAHVPIAEDHPTFPISPYGVTKLAIEKYCGMYARLFGVPIVIARPANPYGPGQVPNRGQGFIATAAAKILQGEPLAVFGACGTIRDYIYIDDLCTAMQLLLSADIAPGAIFNIGSGQGRNNLEIIAAIAAAAQPPRSDVRIEALPPRDFDVGYNVLSSERLHALGWRAPTPLDKGLAHTLPWIAEHLHTA
jgi:UDP-glucose 4-epimerase